MRHFAAVRAVITLALPVSIASPIIAQEQVIDRSAFVRITTSTGQVRGYLSDMDSNALRIYTSAGKPIDFERRAVSRLEVKGSKAAKGAKILGITGLVTGAAFGAAMVAGLCETASCSDDYPKAMITGGVVFGAAGAMTGGLIGSFIPVWTPVDPTKVSFRMRYRP